jgi:hypothetical protein
MKLMKFLPVLAALFAGANAMACYTIYAPGNRVAYHGELPPVDMSVPLHMGLRQAHYPAGSSMVFEEGAACVPMSFAQLARAEMPAPAAANDTSVMGAGPANGKVVRSRAAVVTHPQASSSPLMTTREAAEAMHLPYRVLEGNVVLVPAQAAARVNLPNMTVVSTPPSVVAEARTMRGETVITELHNPPMRVVQNGADTIVSR